MSKNGLSKTTNMQQDIAKKGAVKVGGKPNIGVNQRPSGKHPAATSAPGGKAVGKKFGGV